LVTKGSFPAFAAKRANGGYADKAPNHCTFTSDCFLRIANAVKYRKTLGAWQGNYNWQIPRSASGNPKPMEFAGKKTMDNLAA